MHSTRITLKKLLLCLMIALLIVPVSHAQPLDGLSLKELEAIRLEADARIRQMTLPDAEGYVNPDSWEAYRREPKKHVGEKLKIEGDLFWAGETEGGFLYQISLREDPAQVFLIRYQPAEDQPLLLPGDSVTAFGVFQGLQTAPGGGAGEIGLPCLDASLCTPRLREPRLPVAPPYKGTREDPVRLNTPARVDASPWTGYAELQMEVLQSWRGDAAFKRAQNMSVYNVKPRRAQEYVIVEIRMKALSAARGKAEISEEDFYFVSAEGAEYPQHFLINNSQPLRPLYEGSERTAYIACMIDKGDRPLVVYLPESETPLWLDPNP